MSSFTEKSYKSFELFNKDWALVTAGTKDDYNTCTIGWGELGTIWGHPNHGRPVVTVFVHPSRYTSEYLKKHDTFTVSFYDQKYMKALAYLGSHSGRDGDKVQASGLTPVSMGDGVTFREAKFTFLCHKIYMNLMNRDGLSQEIRDYYAASPKSYQNVTHDGSEEWEPHYAIIGEIIDVKEERQ